MNIGFIGLGKLGLPCAEELATKHNVFGYDIYPRFSNTVKVCETLEEVCKESDIIFVAVQTPHDKKYDGSVPTANLDNKDFDYTVVKKILADLNEYNSILNR